MKERLLTLAFACGALFLFYALMVPKPEHDQQVTQPLSSESGPNGYFVLRRWLETEHVPVISLRERYDKLAKMMSGEQSSGNLMITTMPHRLSARPSELSYLRSWVSNGNTLLIMAGLADTPEWAMDGKHGMQLIKNLSELSGIEFYSARKRDTQKKIGPNAEEQISNGIRTILQSEQREFEPLGNHPLMAGVHSVAAITEFPADDWQARPEEDISVVMTLAFRTSTNAPALWLASYGDGQIIVSGFGSPLTNKLIGKKDNARWLANIVAWSVGPNGRVVIDDAHQGAVIFYDPDAFFGDARLHRAIGWLLLLWLVFVLGPSRLRAPGSDWRPVDVVSFVRATGGFMARVLRPAEAGRRILSLFFNNIRRRVGLPQNGAPVWEWLESQANVSAADLAQLRDYQQRIEQGRRIDFAQLHGLLNRFQGGFV